MAVAHSIEDRKHCHVAQMLVGMKWTRKQVAFAGVVEELHRAIAQRD
jgi:hypothetical protein